MSTDSSGRDLAVRVARRASRQVREWGELSEPWDAATWNAVALAAGATAGEWLNITLACVTEEDAEELVDVMRDYVALLEEQTA